MTPIIDTVVLISPELNEDQAKKIENQIEKRLGMDLKNDKILYEITSKQLQGSYDNRIRLTVKRTKFYTFTFQGKNTTELINCKPYLHIELSLHKFYLGHNIYGGSDDLMFQLEGVINWLEREFNVMLPEFYNFEVQRIDYARVYKLNDLDNFFRGFEKSYYPRRTMINYGVNSVYFPGSWTTLKLYSKEEEFKKHDKKKLKKVLTIDQLKELEEKSKGILRIEVEIRVKKLKDIYGKRPKVKEIDIQHLKDQFIIELNRIMKIGDYKMKKYNNNTTVRERIYNSYDTSLANTLYGVWVDLSLNGYDSVKKKTPKSTFYRYINQLKEIGIVWNQTDIKVNDSKVYFFNPLDTDQEITIDLIAV